MFRRYVVVLYLHRAAAYRALAGSMRFALKGLQQQQPGEGTTLKNQSGRSAYITKGSKGTFDAQEFKLRPAVFYMEAHQEIDIQIEFCSHEVGRHEFDLTAGERSRRPGTFAADKVFTCV